MSAPQKRFKQDAHAIDVEAATTIVLISPFPDDHDKLGTALSTSPWTVYGAANWAYTAHSRSRTVHYHPNGHTGTRRP
jgi:hypothetical protein